MPDQIVRGGTLVTPSGSHQADIAIEDGLIETIAPDLPAKNAAEEIDARGLHIFPALIDVHLHFNEPGRTEWEGAATGSRALAAGGGAVFFDMPLNSTPCTVNAHEFDRKLAALSQSSITDFGLWGGIIPGNAGEMAELADRGVVGFKAFMCDSGLPEFPRADDDTLFEGLKNAARLGLPVAVHAESHPLIASLAPKPGESTVRDFLGSRPVQAEVDAIERATQLAGDARAQLHIVHVSSGRGVAAAVEARARGVDVSIETCPHYLFFTEEDMERLGAIAKCAPPFRDRLQQSALWTALADGQIDIVASDHSPAPPELKSGDFTRAWGGIAGVQSTLLVLLNGQIPLARVSDLLAATPARRFRIPNKGHLAPGNDADITLVNLAQSSKLAAADLHQRHRITPYLGAEFPATIHRTIRRGETIFLNGAITARTCGKFLRPAPQNL